MTDEQRAEGDNDGGIGIIRGRNIVDGEMLSRVSLAPASVQVDRMETVTDWEPILNSLQLVRASILPCD